MSKLVRLGFGAVVAGAMLAGGGATAHAISVGQPPNGCIATAPMEVPGVSAPAGCEYTAGGPQGAYAAATPNDWSITVNGVEVAGTSMGSPPAGMYDTTPGANVVVTIVEACNPLDDTQCGAVGAIAAGDQ